MNFVTVDWREKTRTCPDYKNREMTCGRIHAVEYIKEFEITDDGDLKVTKTVTKTYSQDWATYNDVQRISGNVQISP